MKHLLLWDGDCGFCARCAEWLQSQDRKNLFEIAPHQSKSEHFLAVYNLDYERCREEIKLVTSDGNILGGAEAVNFFLEKYFPWSLIMRIIKRLPPLLSIEKMAYHLTAKNRPLLSKWLETKACSVFPKQ
jgi:predicted DCC family thiol-disulfide oxidoreductase YuxK